MSTSLPVGPTWLPQDASVSEAYAFGVDKGFLRSDPAQMKAAARLDTLSEQLREHGSSTRFFTRLLRTRSVQGVYLVGDVGRGKSLLMDMFYGLAPERKKRRVHFHAFMQETHRALHTMQNKPDRPVDPIAALAERMAADWRLICFDEFQLNDMSDAVMVLRLINAMLERGVVIVATSNTAPLDLLAGNQARISILPQLERFTTRMDVLFLNAARDYRTGRPSDDLAWIFPSDMRARTQRDITFSHYATREQGPETVPVGSRMFHVPAAAGDVARLDFLDLCASASGPAEYLALAKRYRTLIVENVPRLTAERFDEARRFITLIDILYEARTRLFVSAACEPRFLYENGENAKAFERTVSRLEEMRSRTWLENLEITAT